MGKRLLFTIPFILFAYISSYSQVQDNYILVSAESQLQLPANLIIFSINLAEEDTTAEAALKKLNIVENNFVHLLKDFSIPDSNVAYSLKHFERRPSYNKKPIMYQVGEEVNLRLNDPKQYESLQMKLLSIGIYSFHSEFSSTEIKPSKDKGLSKALDNAKVKAEKICKKLKRKLGKVLSVETGDRYQVINPRVRFIQSYQQAGTIRQSLTNIPQHVALTATVKVKYQLK